MPVLEQTDTLLRLHVDPGNTATVGGLIALALMVTSAVFYFRLRRNTESMAPQILIALGGIGFLLMLEAFKTESSDITFDRNLEQVRIQKAVSFGNLRRERHVSFSSRLEASVEPRTVKDSEGRESQEYDVYLLLGKDDRELLGNYGRNLAEARHTADTVNAFLHPRRLPPPQQTPIAPAPRP